MLTNRTVCIVNDNLIASLPSRMGSKWFRLVRVQRLPCNYRNDIGTLYAASLSSRGGYAL